jgi:hypothetical protein
MSPTMNEPSVPLGAIPMTNLVVVVLVLSMDRLPTEADDVDMLLLATTTTLASDVSISPDWIV